jgi:dTDP-4-amino-4,6-dideoxygalactose transaminase
MTRRVPFVDPRKAYAAIKDEIDAAYTDVMTNGELIDRRHLKEFKARLTEFVGTNTRLALQRLRRTVSPLRAAGIGPGDDVMFRAYSWRRRPPWSTREPHRNWSMSAAISTWIRQD